MADKKVRFPTEGALSALISYIRDRIPEVDDSVSQDSSNAASSAAVFAHVAEKLAEAEGISFKPVNELPESGDGNYIYLVPKAEEETMKRFDEYIWFDQAWELLGSADVDLSDFVRTSELHEITADEVRALLNAVWGV